MNYEVNAKACTYCGEVKPLTEYHKQPNTKDGRRNQCKSCMNSKIQAYRSANDGYVKKRTYSTYIERKYGLTIEDLDAMRKEQNYSCAICGKHESANLNGKLAIDHDHATGEVRGLLCNLCNNGLGSFRDSIEHLQAAISYLAERST